jgi:hypothetical protein
MKYAMEDVNCLNQKINTIRKKMNMEYDPNEKRKMQMKIKILELKIMIARIK